MATSLNDKVRRYIPVFAATLLFICVSSAFAQDEEDAVIPYGAVVTGQISNGTPRESYQFDALRCDFISVRLRATSGDLDPVLTITDDSDAAIFSRDDANGSRNVTFEPLRIPKSGRYTVTVGRFGYSLGSTTGSYELLIERIGNGSAYGCALRYGDTVINTVTDMEPEVYYSFRAEQGDIVNIQMRRQSGDLDPYLTVLDSGGYVLESNDDVPGSGTDAEVRSLLIPADGTYYILASRYGLAAGRSSGNFVLTLEETENSGLGNSPLAAVPIRYGLVQENTLSEDSYEHYYRFEAQQNDIISVRMNRLSGSVDSFLVIADVNLQELVSDDDSGEGRNAFIDGFLVPADGTYYIIATRFEREEGTTTGRYRVELRSQGNAFDSVPETIRRISYGTSVTGTIDDVTPEVYYAFWGMEGDAITVSMSRGDGDLDPVVSILAEDQRSVYLSDDDGGVGQNALIERFVLPTTGIYYIRGTRYSGEDNPDTSGSYVMVLAQRFDDE